MWGPLEQLLLNSDPSNKNLFFRRRGRDCRNFLQCFLFCGLSGYKNRVFFLLLGFFPFWGFAFKISVYPVTIVDRPIRVRGAGLEKRQRNGYLIEAGHLAYIGTVHRVLVRLRV